MISPSDRASFLFPLFLIACGGGCATETFGTSRMNDDETTGSGGEDSSAAEEETSMGGSSLTRPEPIDRGSGGASSGGAPSGAGGTESSSGGASGGMSSETGGSGGTSGEEPKLMLARLMLIASADARIISNRAEDSGGGSHANKNFGTEEHLNVGVYDNNTISRSLIRFDLPEGIEPHDLEDATLSLYPKEWTSKHTTDDYTFHVHRLLNDWKEGSGNNEATSLSIDGVTGNERFWGSQNGDEDWATPGVALDDMEGTSAALQSATLSSGSTEKVSLDVTAAVRSWLSKPNENFGVLLIADGDQNGQSNLPAYPAFHSRESAETAKRPALIVDYWTEVE